MHEIDVNTSIRKEFIDITCKINEVLKENNWQNGLLMIFIPHTTAAVTVNEHADPDVVCDILKKLSQLIPYTDDYSHCEGNSDAHIKASLIGNSLTVSVENGKLALGTWQGIFFCEFDGARHRKVWLKFIKA